jgi:NAD(P)-dependent dehydrogenase (short-subunit alcohol dehydrogenase family)
VLGSSGQLGAEVVRVLVAGGASVWAVDRVPPASDGASRTPEGSASVRRLTADLADAASVERLVATLREELGSPAPEHPVWIVGCAGHIGVHDTALDAAGPEVWQELYATHVIGPVQVVTGLRASMPVGSSVVLVTSVNAEAPSPWIHYATSKAAAGKVVEDLAARLAADGIRVCGVAPTRFRGPGDVRPGELPLHGIDLPVEAVVHALLFLADSRTSPATTGITLRIDGGLAVWHPRLESPPS